MFSQLFETDEAGVYISKNLVYGDYLLKETKAPDNYLIDDNYYPFSVRNDGEVISITTENRSVFANEPKLCNYFDIPIQHCSDKILKLMGRKTNSAQIRALIDKIRSRINN